MPILDPQEVKPAIASTASIRDGSRGHNDESGRPESDRRDDNHNQTFADDADERKSEKLCWKYARDVN